MGNNELDGSVWRWSPSPACGKHGSWSVRRGEAYSRPCRLRLVIERGDYSTSASIILIIPETWKNRKVMVSSSRKARFPLPPLKTSSGTCQWRRGVVHQPVHAAARTTVRVRFPFVFSVPQQYGTALFVPSVAGASLQSALYG